MNLIDELHKGKQSMENLCKIYYFNILKKVGKIIEENQEFTKESYEIFKRENPGMEYCTFQDVEALIDLSKKWKRYENYEVRGKFTVNTGEREKKQIQREIKRRTNIALARRLATEMKTCNTLLTEDDYQILYNLGYRGEMDRKIPEIVAGNFNIFMENKRLRTDCKGKIEAINRIQIFLDNVPESASKKKQEDGAKEWLTSEEWRIESIERMLGDKCFADDWDRLQYLEEFSRDRLQHFYYGVNNEENELRKKMMNDTIDVTKETYETLSCLGFDEYNVHEIPIVQSGFELYRENWIQNKMIDRYSKVLKLLVGELRERRYAYTFLQPEPDPDINPMSSLDIDIQMFIVSNEYKKGEISKEAYMEVKERKAYIDSGGKNPFVPERIKGVKGPSRRFSRGRYENDR